MRSEFIRAFSRRPCAYALGLDHIPPTPIEEQTLRRHVASRQTLQQGFKYQLLNFHHFKTGGIVGADPTQIFQLAITGELAAEHFGGSGKKTCVIAERLMGGRDGPPEKMQRTEIRRHVGAVERLPGGVSNLPDVTRNAEHQAGLFVRFAYRRHRKRIGFALGTCNGKLWHQIFGQGVRRLRSIIGAVEAAAGKHIHTRLKARLAAAAPHQNFVMGVAFAMNDEAGGITGTNRGHGVQRSSEVRIALDSNTAALGRPPAGRLYCCAMIACFFRPASHAFLLRSCLLLLCLSIATAVLAVPGLPDAAVETTPAQAAAPVVPDPRNLDPEWWNYFVVGADPDGKLLDGRYTALTTQLDSIAATLSGQERNDLAQLRASIERHFGRYKRTLQTPAAAPLAPSVLKKAYPLDDVLELGRENEQLRRAADLEAQEIVLIERSLALGRNDQDAAKLRYRDLADNSAARVVEGVRLVRDRLRIETLNQELRWRRAHQSALVAELDQHFKQLTTAGERIECTASALEEWKRAEKEAANAAHSASADLMKLQLTGSIALATSPDERAQARYHDIKTLRRGVEIAIAEARRASAVVAQRLLQRVAERNTTEPGADRGLLRKQQALLDGQARVAAEQSARAAQLRSAITIEREAADEPAVTTLYERARTELAGVETALEDLAAQLRSGTQLVDMLDERLREREGRVGQSVRLLKDAVRGSVSEAHTLLSYPLFAVNEAPVTTLGLLRLGLIVTIAWWLSALMRGGLQRLGPRNSAFSPASLYTVGRVLHYLLLIIGLVVGLSSIGVDLTKFALFASALGIGVGFGLQTLISNFVAGLIILFEKSLNVGDLIELQSGATGMVKEINMRATRITTSDNVDILVPNAEFMSSKVMNWTLEDACRRIHVPFTVTYETDKTIVQTAALAAARDVEHTLSGNPNREAQVWLVRFGDTGLDFELVVWLNLRAITRPGSVISDYCWALDTRLREYGIEIAWPKPAATLLPHKAAQEEG